MIANFREMLEREKTKAQTRSYMIYISMANTPYPPVGFRLLCVGLHCIKLICLPQDL